MADLSDIQAAEAVKIIGSGSTGTEGTPVSSSANGDLRVSDTLVGSGTEGAITVGTSAVEARVGGAALSNRKLLTVYNNSNSTIYWGYTNAVTTSSGTPIEKSQLASWDISDASGATVYLIAGSAGNNVRVTEGA